MKKELLERLETEIKACKKYTENSIKRAREGKRSQAIEFYDIARTAKTCADQTHDKLWEETKGNLTDKEFEIFTKAETLWKELKKAYEEIKRKR